MEVKKTIFMSREQWNTWKEALLSGKYKQGKNILYAPGTGGFCCLGVMEHCLTGEVEDSGLPSIQWLRNNNINFSGDAGGHLKQPYVKYEARWVPVAELNDRWESFENIVKLMEPHVQFTDEENFK